MQHYLQVDERMSLLETLLIVPVLDLMKGRSFMTFENALATVKRQNIAVVTTKNL